METIRSSVTNPAIREPRSRVEVRVRADPAELPSVRSVATALGALGGLDVDDLADLRLAVDHACSILIDAAAPDSDVECLFVVNDRLLDFRATVAVPPGRPPPHLHGFSRHVLRVLTDELEISEPSAEPADWGRMAIRFTRHRGGSE